MKSKKPLWLYYVLGVFLNSTFIAQESLNLLTQAHDSIANHQYAHAITLYKELLHTFPNHSTLLGNIGYAYKKLCDYKTAILWYQKALLHDPHNARLLRGIAHAYLMIGDFNNGWPAYEYRWVQPPTYNATFISFMHNGGNVRNKIILVRSEYGLGDVLQFIRYTQLLHFMGATIIVQSHESLVPLLSLCPYIDRILLPHDTLPEHDFSIMVMSLPLAFKTTINTIPHNVPYLYASQELIDYWKHKINNQKKIKIGICWQANMHLTSDNRTVCDDACAKSLPIEMLRSIAQIPMVQLYSLQKNVSDQEKNNIDFPMIFFDDFDHSHGAFMDSAALMTHLDLIITIDTALAHLAGGLGIRTWLLLPYHADWRWLKDINYSPWYPQMQLFRQTNAHNWKSVIEKIKQELECMIFV